MIGSTPDRHRNLNVLVQLRKNLHQAIHSDAANVSVADAAGVLVRASALRVDSFRSSRTPMICAATMARSCLRSALGLSKSRKMLPLPRTSSKSSLLIESLLQSFQPFINQVYFRLRSFNSALGFLLEGM